MAKNRMDLINAEIQKALSHTFTYDIHSEVLNGAIITVTKVDTTNDMKYAKVYLSIFPDANKDVVFNNIKQTIPFLRREVAHNVKLRITPELHLFLDDSLEYSQKIDNLLSKINK
ncbi:MAG: 30S ribosome-binding factor RbfA [Clostridiales bacterium]|nr:30S ribosome-binding factor RbfA [Candidatus Apopatousia equi]